MNTDLEQNLFRELRPVAAPRELWSRVHRGQADTSCSSSLRYSGWAIAGLAAVLMVTLALNFHNGAAIQTLTPETNPAQFRSTQAVEIRGCIRLPRGSTSA